ARRNPALASLTAALLVLSMLVGTAAILFRRDIVNGNMQEAALAAQVIGEQLGELRQEVAQIATAPSLAALLGTFEQTGNPAALESFLDGQRAFSDDGGAQWLGEAKHFHSLNLFGPDGTIIARSPPSEGQYEGTYQGRDYFAGAMALPPDGNPYISMIYDSRTDSSPTSRDKFGISLPIDRPDGSRCVLMASVPTTASSTLSGFGRNVVLIGRRDPTNQLRDKFGWLVIAHPSFGSESEAIGIPELSIPESQVPGGKGFYFDPASSTHPRYSGPWLAGSAWAEAGKLIVIVQTRDRVTNALVAAAAVAGAAGFGLIFARILRRRRGAPDRPASTKSGQS
ncbi:MAG: cache domain-containing protein, partial [Verrucomicrobiales bacterium]